MTTSERGMAGTFDARSEPRVDRDTRSGCLHPSVDTIRNINLRPLTPSWPTWLGGRIRLWIGVRAAGSRRCDCLL